MPAKVSLKVTKGELSGKEIVFDKPGSCILGRSEDCAGTRFPESDTKVSRLHCLLDINPPDITIRDYGSRNGTYLNLELIGQREKGMTPEEGQQLVFTEHDLEDGDEIGLGGKERTVLKVEISVPVFCSYCAREVPGMTRATAAKMSSAPICDTCREKRERKSSLKKKKPTCGQCGKDVSEEVGDKRRGDFVCASCQQDPMAILQSLLSKAKTGEKDLLGVEGYHAVRELARGGMGAVYLARHEATGDQVAVKVMLPKVAANERARDLFLSEIAKCKLLQHHNVVQTRYSGCSNGVYYMSMDYCDGGTADITKKDPKRTWPVADALDVILQALDGLEYAHNVEIPNEESPDEPIRGLVHRDLKPANILLSGTGCSRVAKVADFGLAKAIDRAGFTNGTRTGDKAGTFPFMSRQQVVNFKYAKPEVDVWAMAATLYYMLTCCYTRHFDRGKDMCLAILETDPVPIRQRDPSIPKRLAQVIDEALVDKPDIKFKSAAELKEALEKAR